MGLSHSSDPQPLASSGFVNKIYRRSPVLAPCPTLLLGPRALGMHVPKQTNKQAKTNKQTTNKRNTAPGCTSGVFAASNVEAPTKTPPPIKKRERPTARLRSRPQGEEQNSELRSRVLSGCCYPEESATHRRCQPGARSQGTVQYSCKGVSARDSRSTMLSLTACQKI